MFLFILLQLLSIGISDAIELYFNPQVHQYHNAPDIMRMDFQNYGYRHAFLSGIRVSWFLLGFQYIILSLLGTTNLFPIIPFSILNILMPIFVDHSIDYYRCHKYLYLSNMGCFIVLVLLNSFKIII